MRSLVAEIDKLNRRLYKIQDEIFDLVNDFVILANDLADEAVEVGERNKEFHYYKVDVLLGKNGYSFMVATTYELDDVEVLQLALKNSLFKQDTDRRYARVDDLVSQYDIDHFKQINCINYL